VYGRFVGVCMTGVKGGVMIFSCHVGTRGTEMEHCDSLTTCAS